ncbi:ESCRT-1 complex, Vps28 subunit [Piromyces finnis]|uniref:Vacuolar protein sorting-associated protein 28 n=1 Tax=Piromyces finnis TaxID=1754191 RepID=A0A1Y1VDZ7_9FUNG|nr:ESCRT-1 complex, Vps28 subunit [Piromyces finnis]|eukprot:ORX52973.1 ESCRT-1 complex, Vps28 subunit [Piromyces finnis]
MYFNQHSPTGPNQDQEVKLYNSNLERERLDTLADLYSIIVAVEHLEKAYIKSSIPFEEYTLACTNLISQFKTCQNLLGDSSVLNVQHFMNEYKLNCPLAVNRLKVGVPATVEHGVDNKNNKEDGKYIAKTVQNFINLMDNLELKVKTVEVLHPLLVELIQNINKITPSAETNECKEKVKNWLIALNKMKVSDELNDEQVKQLHFDLENGYNLFMRSLDE